MRQLKISESITQRTSDCLNKYIADVSHIDLVDTKEETLLAERIKKGDQVALNRLVSANLRFVISVAKKYQNAGVELTDLIQEGNIGLITAAMKFDPTKGFKFISYAVWWIRQQIMQYLSENGGAVRLPANQVALMGKIAKASAEYEQKNGNMPSAAILADLLDESEHKIQEILGINTKGLSIDAPLTDDSDSNRISDLMKGNLENTDKKAEDAGLRTEFMDILNKMDREGEVLRLHFGIGCQAKTLEEISQMMNLTRERVRQIKEKGIKRIRNNKELTSVLKDYLN